MWILAYTFSLVLVVWVVLNNINLFLHIYAIVCNQGTTQCLIHFHPPPNRYKYSSNKNYSSRWSFLLYSVFTPYKDLDSKTYLTYRNISIFALLNIFFLIFVFSPFAVYSSDVSQFDPSQTFQTLGGLFGFFLLFSFLGIYTTSFFYKTRLLKLGVYGVSVILCIGLVYTFVLVGDYARNSYGILEHFVFQGGTTIYSTYNKWFDILYCSIAMLLCALMFYYLPLVRIKQVFMIISIFLFCYASFYFVKISLMSHHKHNISPVPPSYSEKLLAFSKHKNILVLVLDAFTGSHFHIILDQNPKLRESLLGFTYYDNTLATSNNTQFNTPAMIGGYNYTTLSILQSEYKNHKDKWLEAFFSTIAMVHNSDFEVAMYGIDPIDPKKLQKTLVDKLPQTKNITIADPSVENYVQPYIAHYNLGSFFEKTFNQYKKQYNSIGGLISIGLFKASPYSIRARIYTNDQWLFASDNPANDFSLQIRYFSDIAMFPNLSTTSAKTKTFKYIKSLSTHWPWYLDVSMGCIPNIETKSQLPSPYREINVQEYQKAYNNNHYNNEVCAMYKVSLWLEWMKTARIYDNTAIIILSDHGHYDSFKQIQNNAGKQLGKQSDALLLVKPFGARTPFSVNHTLMSNADLHSMICTFIDMPCQIIDPHNTPNRVLYHSNSNFEENLSVERVFQVTDDIYKPENWKDITQKFKQHKNLSSIP